MSTSDDRPEGPPRGLSLTWRVRLALLLVAAALGGVFALAAWLDPYDASGNALRMETHRQFGLPECTFKTLTDRPCPSCGMTTSFALLIRGDVVNAWRANEVGAALAVFLLLLIPWALVSIVRGRFLFVRSLEWTLTWTVATFLTLLLVRWALVLAFRYE